MKGRCFWEENEIPNCIKCECGKISFSPAALSEDQKIERATRRLRVKAAKYNPLPEETVNDARRSILGVEEQTETSELEKKAALAVEIAEIITARTGSKSGQMETLRLVVELLFGGRFRVVCS